MIWGQLWVAYLPLISLQYPPFSCLQIRSRSYADILKIIFRHEAIIVLITGEWKSGKTNVGLKIAEDLRTLRLIEKVGTNIKIVENDFIKYIEDFDNLNQFHFDDSKNPSNKLFIFDEV